MHVYFETRLNVTRKWSCRFKRRSSDPKLWWFQDFILNNVFDTIWQMNALCEMASVRSKSLTNLQNARGKAIDGFERKFWFFVPKFSWIPFFPHKISAEKNGFSKKKHELESNIIQSLPCKHCKTKDCMH